MTNEQYIELLNPLVVGQFRMFFDLTKERGWKEFINNTYRSFELQNSLYLEDNRNTKAGYSKHNYGMAVDVNFYKNGITLRKATDKNIWLESGIPELASRCGIEWGGSYKSYYDPIHFEVNEPSIKVMLALKQAQKVDGNKVVFS